MKTISDNEFPHIAGVETTSEAWSQLSAAKETWTLDAIVNAQATLHDIKAYEGQPMAEHITNLQKAAADLQELGEPYPDNRFAMVISASLPKSWRPFTRSYWAGKTIDSLNSIRSSDLIMRILQEEQSEKKAKVAELANHAATSFNMGKRTQSDHDNKHCSNCNRDSHTFSECYSKGGGSEGKGP